MNNIPTIKPTKEEFNSLLNVIQTKKNEITNEQILYLRVYPSRDIVISFDRDREPFLCSKQGYNPPKDRHYLQHNINLFQNIIPILRKHMRGEPRSGGRFFFSKSGIWKKDEFGEKEEVVSWEMPSEIALMLRQL